MPVTLNSAELAQIHEAVVRLQLQFDAKLNQETIERFMNNSLETLAERATTSTWVPRLAERLTPESIAVAHWFASRPT